MIKLEIETERIWSARLSHCLKNTEVTSLKLHTVTYHIFLLITQEWGNLNAIAVQGY